MTFVSAQFFTDHIFPVFFVIDYVKSFLLVAIKRESGNYGLVFRANYSAGLQSRRILRKDVDLFFN